ncbi:MAG TPA: peptidase T [Saprospiraceae bacterium]|nr:peptidase T [Saprospiraceae bacterium]
MKEKVLERFLRYIAVDTKSDDSSETTPSTEKQFNLANMLKKELEDLGLVDISLDEKCYLMATLPANTDKPIPTIGFIAHMDTAPDMSGENVNPQFWPDYQGQDLVINAEKNLVLSTTEFPELKMYFGNTIITTDGNTLLGADDKAGVAEIMTAIEYLIEHPEIKHGTIKVGFTPDEEIGRGVDHFDVAKFGAKYAYTLDGGMVGELEYENFNAAGAKVHIQGRNIHPGYAKGKMLNSILIGMEFNSLLPVFDRPEFTEKYEGFYHLIKMEGSVEKAMLQYIIRDHDREKFEQKKKLITEAVEFMKKRYGEDVFRLELNDQYFNMREMVEPVFHIVELAKKAMEDLGIEPHIVPIRGGTDGSRLSYMGLPCPNIFAGGHNFHGKFEYVPIESMEKAAKVIVRIVELYEQADVTA